MDFVITPQEVWKTARVIGGHLRDRKLTVLAEQPVDAEAPFTTTLLGRKASDGLELLVEVQHHLRYTQGLIDLTHWLRSQRRYCQLYLGTSHESALGAGVLSQLQRDGVGLMVVSEDEQIQTPIPAANPALLVSPDPTLRFGPAKSTIEALVNQFNAGSRKDSLRDLYEYVEEKTGSLARKVCRKGLVATPEAAISGMNWSSRIDLLGKPTLTVQGRPLLSPDLKADLHSFRGGRNLLDHPARNARERARRERQFGERMMMGTRLVAELVAADRRVR